MPLSNVAAGTTFIQQCRRLLLECDPVQVQMAPQQCACAMQPRRTQRACLIEPTACCSCCDVQQVQRGCRGDQSSSRGCSAALLRGTCAAANIRPPDSSARRFPEGAPKSPPPWSCCPELFWPSSWTFGTAHGDNRGCTQCGVYPRAPGCHRCACWPSATPRPSRCSTKKCAAPPARVTGCTLSDRLASLLFPR